MAERSNCFRCIGNFNKQSEKMGSPKLNFIFFVFVVDENNAPCVRVFRHVTKQNKQMNNKIYYFEC